MYQFSAAELDALRAASLNQLVNGTPEYQAAIDAIAVTLGHDPSVPGSVPPEGVLQIIVEENSGKPWAAFYTLAAHFAEQGGTAADDNSIEWLRGAAGVNRGDTAAADFIRGYTAAQIDARSGQTITDAQLQFASDEIARDVLDDILTSGGVLPSISEIGQNDVGGTFAALAQFGLPTDIAIWSGNLLFPGLGDASFFVDNLLTTDGETYDLFTAAYATQEAGYLNFLLAGASSPFALFSNAGDINAATSAATVFLSNAYGTDGTSLAAALGLSDVVVGSNSANDDLTQESDLTNNTFMHGGAGDDLLVGSLGTDLLDGGVGTDIASYENLTNAQPFSLTAFLYNLPSTAAFSAEITGSGLGATIFNVEQLTLGLGDDVLVVNELTSTTTSLQSISGGEHQETGDTIDLSSAVAITDGAAVSLETGTLSFQYNATTLSITDFENVIGSDRDDTITGSSGDNIIEGGNGVDVLEGGAGDDVLIIDVDDVNINGGEGRDIMVLDDTESVTLDLTASSIEVAVGGVGNDTLMANWTTETSIVMSGGAGDDVLIYATTPGSGGGSIGTIGPVQTVFEPVVMWGGAGADTFDLVGVGGILVLDLDLNGFDITTFSYEALGLNIDWNEIGAILINPDSEDVINFFAADGAAARLDVGRFGQYGTINSQGGGAVYSSYLFPGFDGGVVVDNFAWSERTSFLGGTYIVQGAFGAVDAIPAADFNPYQQAQFGIGAANGGAAPWFIVGAEMDGTTIDTSAGEDFSGFSFGTEEDDTLFGGDDIDRFIHSGGSNAYSGGGGFNSVSYGGIDGAVTVNLTTGVGSVFGPSSTTNDTYTDIQSVFGATGDDQITGSAVANELSGAAGDDTLEGGSGDDTILGGSGDDLMSGGEGADTYTFLTSDGNDTISDFDIAEDVLIINGFQIDPNALFMVSLTQVNNDVVVEFGADPFTGLGASVLVLQDVSLESWKLGNVAQTVIGTSSADIINATFVDAAGNSISDAGQLILAGEGRDQIYDGAGDDTVDGGTGRDRFFAGEGSDTYIGGGDRDELFYSTSTTGLTIDMVDTGNNTGIAVGDSYFEIEYLHGSNFDDLIVATTERVFGRDGDDIIQDSEGLQRMFGGDGSDVFRFVDADSERDRISDFELGNDRIDLSLWGVTSLHDTGLLIEERMNGQGTLLGDLVITYNGNNNYIRIDGLNTADIALLDASHFIFT